MKLLILGSEGFIGSHLARFYVAKGYKVYGCDLVENPTADYTYTKVSLLSEEINQLFSKNTFDVCINAAGNGNVAYSLTNPISDFENNVYAVTRILNAIKIHVPSCFFIHISSAAVYGNPVRLPINEDDHVKPISIYGWNKYLSELACKEYTEVYNLKTAIVRPFSVYGPGLRKQLFWDLYKKAKAGLQTIELWGNGTESRDFIFISDLIKAIDHVVQFGDNNAAVYNLAVGSEVSIKEVAEIFFQFVDAATVLRFNGIQKQGDPLNWKADITKITKLGFVPEINYREGLKLVTKWLKDQN